MAGAVRLDRVRAHPVSALAMSGDSEVWSPYDAHARWHSPHCAQATTMGRRSMRPGAARHPLTTSAASAAGYHDCCGTGGMWQCLYSVRCCTSRKSSHGRTLTDVNWDVAASLARRPSSGKSHT